MPQNATFQKPGSADPVSIAVVKMRPFLTYLGVPSIVGEIIDRVVELGDVGAAGGIGRLIIDREVQLAVVIDIGLMIDHEVDDQEVAITAKGDALKMIEGCGVAGERDRGGHGVRTRHIPLDVDGRDHDLSTTDDFAESLYIQRSSCILQTVDDVSSEQWLLTWGAVSETCNPDFLLAWGYGADIAVFVVRRVESEEHPAAHGL